MPTVHGLKYFTSREILQKILNKRRTPAKKRKSPSVKKTVRRASLHRSRSAS